MSLFINQSKSGFTAKTLIQVIVFLGVCSAVGSVLVLRELRAASRYALEVKSTELEDLVGDPGGVVRRATVDNYFGGDLPTMPKRESGMFLKRAFPVDEAQEVLLKGGLVGELQPPRVLAPSTVAYAYEVAFHRWIESNDGQRIVELRYFDRVRRAKIVTPEAGLKLDLGQPGERLLNGLRASEPGGGISIAPVDRLAAAILGCHAERVMNNPDSRAFVEDDALTDRWVRITHLAGVGVECVEPLGGALSFDEAAYLFRQSLATAVTLPLRQQRWGGMIERCLAVDQFEGFFEPGLDPMRHPDFFVEVVPARSVRSVAYRLFQLEEDAATAESGESGAAAGDLIGTLRCDASTRRITSARLRWPIRELALDRGKLLFERDFEGSPELTILYTCRVP